MIEHPSGKAPVDPAKATLRHPGPMGMLTTALGAAPQELWYEAKFNFASKPTGIDFDGVIDYREAFAAHHAPFVESLKLCGKLGVVTKKATIPLASLAPGSYPLELWGDDPTLLHQNPSLWLFNQNGDARYPAWTEWKLRGLFRKIAGPQGPRKTPSPWMAQLERQGQVALLAEGTNQIFTLRELSKNLHSPNGSLQKEAAKIFNSVPYLFGRSYWGCYATIPPKEHAFWETAALGSPKCNAWLLAHTTQDPQGRTYAKTQDFALVPAGYFDVYSSRNGSRDKLWDFERKLGSSSVHTLANLQKITQDVFMGSDFASAMGSLLPKPKGP